MPGRLDGVITQGGTNVSGGQRQRLAIARAVVRRPEIYLFDDSFSALDLATDARLRAALAPVTADSTVIVVAQRVSTIRTADQILVLEDGRTVGLGTHRELMETCPTYLEIVESQMTRKRRRERSGPVSASERRRPRERQRAGRRWGSGAAPPGTREASGNGDRDRPPAHAHRHRSRGW